MRRIECQPVGLWRGWKWDVENGYATNYNYFQSVDFIPL